MISGDESGYRDIHWRQKLLISTDSVLFRLQEVAACFACSTIQAEYRTFENSDKEVENKHQRYLYGIFPGPARGQISLSLDP